jgi:hypothetical protein
MEVGRLTETAIPDNGYHLVRLAAAFEQSMLKADPCDYRQIIEQTFHEHSHLTYIWIVSKMPPDVIEMINL